METTRNIANETWTGPRGETSGYESQTPRWAIFNEAGLALSHDGKHPTTGGSRKVDATIAESGTAATIHGLTATVAMNGQHPRN